MPQRTIRFSETTIKQIRQAARQKGLTSTAIVRHAVEQALSGSEEAVERRIAATLDQIRGDLSRMQRVQQTLFAFVDTLAKALLDGLTEQSSASVALSFAKNMASFSQLWNQTDRTANVDVTLRGVTSFQLTCFD